MPVNQQRLDRAIQKFIDVRKVRPIDKSYLTEYKKFVKWCEENDHEPQSADNGTSTRYVHRHAVDSYFRTVVPTRNGNTNSISRIANSLQWAWDNVECRDSPDAPTFVVKNNIAKECIKRQQESWRERSATLNLGVDPHKGLKDITPENEMRIVMHHVYKCRNDWDSLGPTFTWGNNAGSRGAANRNFV